MATKMDNSEPTFAKMLQDTGYQTAMIGKWHLGHKPENYPAGFDYWNILPGQGKYHNPDMIEMGDKKRYKGYVTDLITDFSLEWLRSIDKSKPFLLMCHHKAPHRSWEPDEKHIQLYRDKDIPIPKTFNDVYEGRPAAQHAFMRITDCLNPRDLKIKLPIWKRFKKYLPLPPPRDIKKYRIKTKKRFSEKSKTLNFESQQELKEWKYQRYIKDYLRCIASVDDNVGRLLDYLEDEGLMENTIVIYTSDQGFFLGDHGWYDKRFMLEESLRMPFVIQYPKEIGANSINTDIITNIDFAETFLDYAGVDIPENMQGYSVRPLLNGNTPDDWQDSLYYRYWVNGTYHKVYAHYGIRTHTHKLIYYYCDPLDQKGARKDTHEPYWELYDLEKDPYEINNVYNDSAYADVVTKLKDRLDKLQEKVGDQPYRGETKSKLI